MNRMGGAVRSQEKNKIEGVNFQEYRNLTKGVRAHRPAPLGPSP